MWKMKIGPSRWGSIFIVPRLRSYNHLINIYKIWQLLNDKKLTLNSIFQFTTPYISFVEDTLTGPWIKTTHVAGPHGLGHCKSLARNRKLPFPPGPACLTHQCNIVLADLVSVLWANQVSESQRRETCLLRTHGMPFWCGAVLKEDWPGRDFKESMWARVYGVVRVRERASEGSRRSRHQLTAMINNRVFR
jgi:hypothetical protein